MNFQFCLTLSSLWGREKHRSITRNFVVHKVRCGSKAKFGSYLWRKEGRSVLCPKAKLDKLDKQTIPKNMEGVFFG